MLWGRDLFIIKRMINFIEIQVNLSQENFIPDEKNFQEAIKFLNWLYEEIEKSKFKYSLEKLLTFKTKDKLTDARDLFIAAKVLEYCGSLFEFTEELKQRFLEFRKEEVGEVTFENLRKLGIDYEDLKYSMYFNLARGPIEGSSRIDIFYEPCNSKLKIVKERIKKRLERKYGRY